MEIGRKELMNLENELDRLTEFIRCIEPGELPYFYKYFDAMKNNIRIYLYVGREEIDKFFPVLERDWKAAHMEFIGVQYFDLRKSHPDIDQELCLCFAGMLAAVGKYFEPAGRVFVRYGAEDE